jgi:hypothetical protein
LLDLSQWNYPMNRDAEHVRLLSIFYYIVGGLTAVCSCFPLIHVGIGAALLSGKLPAPRNGAAPPPELGWFFLVGGAAIILIGWTMAILMIVTGRCLSQRKARTFCIVIAAILCLSVPFGTVLGVFTIVVLVRPSVQLLFEGSAKPSVQDPDAAW